VKTVWFYDFEGNLTAKERISDGQTTEYTWDYRNRLTDVTIRNSATGPAVLEDRFTYDVENRRIGKWTDPDGEGSQAGVQTYTVYDGVNPYMDLDAKGNVMTRYLYGPGTDELYARVVLDPSSNGYDTPRYQPTWYVTDRLESVRALVDYHGAAIDRIVYDSYGNIESESNPAAGDRFKFTAREWNGEIGLQSNRARYYDPAAGRWISQDPIGFAGEDTDLYRYVGNRPVNTADPTGLQEPASSSTEENIPTYLPGEWNVYLSVNYLNTQIGHAWIVYQSVQDPTVCHSASKSKIGWGPNSTYSGTHWDLDLGRLPVDAQIGPVKVSNPVIYNSVGYNVLSNNCSTYAATVWEKYTGEHIGMGLCPSPANLAAQFDRRYSNLREIVKGLRYQGVLPDYVGIPSPPPPFFAPPPKKRPKY
jgi:RHS repeat-associated protein